MQTVIIVQLAGKYSITNKLTATNEVTCRIVCPAAPS